MVETGPNEEKKVISDLRPYSHYTLVVSVYNKKGEGPPSEMLSFKTEEGGKNTIDEGGMGDKAEMGGNS